MVLGCQFSCAQGSGLALLQGITTSPVLRHGRLEWNWRVTLDAQPHSRVPKIPLTWSWTSGTCTNNEVINKIFLKHNFGLEIERERESMDGKKQSSISTFSSSPEIHVASPLGEYCTVALLYCSSVPALCLTRLREAFAHIVAYSCFPVAQGLSCAWTQFWDLGQYFGVTSLKNMYHFLMHVNC